jgi:hypothetical protein
MKQATFYRGWWVGAVVGAIVCVGCFGKSQPSRFYTLSAMAPASAVSDPGQPGAQCRHRDWAHQDSRLSRPLQDRYPYRRQPHRSVRIRPMGRFFRRQPHPCTGRKHRRHGAHGTDLSLPLADVPADRLPGGAGYCALRRTTGGRTYCWWRAGAFWRARKKKC